MSTAQLIDGSSNLIAAGNPLPTSAALTKQASATDVLQNAATGDGNGTTAIVDGYDGQVVIFVSNGAGTTTLNVETSLDSGFAVTRDTVSPGLVKLWDSIGGTNTNRSTVSGSQAIAANTSYLFALTEVLPYVRGRLSGSAGLAGCSVTLYRMPV